MKTTNSRSSLTDNDLKTYETLLRSSVTVRWTNEDIQRLYDEVVRLRSVVEPERPTALRDHWIGLPRFVGGH
jgi:hypothetical protein